MEFEWDAHKNEGNITKHGIAFEQALAVFNDPYLVTIHDVRFQYSELRQISIGQLFLSTQKKLIIIVVVHTNRDKKTRIISARKANKKERKVYEKQSL